MGLRARRAASREWQIEMAEQAAAGDAVRGVVVGPTRLVSVGLLRVEESPAGTYFFSVDSCDAEPLGDRAAFELALPSDLPPGSAGDRCRLAYVVRAMSVGRRRGRQLASQPVEISGGERRLREANGFRLDRVIPSHAGRRLRVELSDASLQGGGRLIGRVHTDGALNDGMVDVIVRCEEAWCTNLRFRPRRFPPLWSDQRLWEEVLSVELAADRNWYPFRFDIPACLPTAVEGRAISWRYTVEARRAGHVPFADSAIVTPLRFDV